jgi:hypothetical protein
MLISKIENGRSLNPVCGTLYVSVQISRRFLRNVGNHLPDYKLICHCLGYLTFDTNELG